MPCIARSKRRAVLPSSEDGDPPSVCPRHNAAQYERRLCLGLRFLRQR